MFIKSKNRSNNEIKMSSSDLMVDGKIELTLSKICRAFRVSIPSELSCRADEVISRFSVDTEKIIPETFFLVHNYAINLQEAIINSEEGGALGVFVDKESMKVVEDIPHTIPVIFVENLVPNINMLFRELLRVRNLRKVAVTGTVGKTTTKEMIRLAAQEKYKTFFSKKNNNSFRTIYKNILYRIEAEDEVYVQEVGAGYGGMVRYTGSIIEPDIFVITNVHPHHINEYGTFEKLFEDKISVQDYMPKSGVIVVNYDDEGLANTEFKRKVISVGIETKKKVKYRGENIHQNNEVMEMDIVYGRKKKHIKINVIGVHNAYNVLEAFAVARELGIEDDIALKAIAKFRTNGIRQNYKNIGGVGLLMDCYNVCGASIETGLMAVEEFKLKDGAKRVAILGGENKLGENASEITYEFGKSIADSAMDYIICVGSEGSTPKDIDDYGDGKTLYQGLMDGGYEKAEFISDRGALLMRLKELVKPGDLLFVKGIWLLDLAQIIDQTFGTAYSFNHSTYSIEGKKIKAGDFTAKLIRNMPGVEIIEYMGNDRQVTIPDNIAGHPVFRIAAGVFKDHEEIHEINLGNSIVNIGVGAFAGCKSLKTIEIPASVKMIAGSAFAGCGGLEEVTLNEGLTHIGPKVFSDCPRLAPIKIPQTVGFAAKDITKKDISKD